MKQLYLFGENVSYFKNTNLRNKRGDVYVEKKKLDKSWIYLGENTTSRILL